MGPILTRTARAVGLLLQKKFEREGFDVSAEQWTVLANLFFKKDGQFQQQLADRTYKNKAAITRLIAGLEKKELVHRVEDDQDKRQKRVYLTDKGAAIMDSLIPVARATQMQGLDNVRPEHRDIFISVLHQIFENVTES